MDPENNEQTGPTTGEVMLSSAEAAALAFIGFQERINEIVESLEVSSSNAEVASNTLAIRILEGRLNGLMSMLGLRSGADNPDFQDCEHIGEPC